MSHEVVFDIETRGDIKDFANLKITVVSIYEYESDKYTSFEEHELSNLWPILEKAERLIGFNSGHFDLPIMNKYYTGDLMFFPHLDLLEVVKDTSGKRYKLNDLAKATLQIEKSADGLQAMKWFEEGKMDEIKKYCEQDVKVTKEIYEYGVKNKMLYFPMLTGEIQPIAVNFDMPKNNYATQGQSGSGINLTLPF
ncbi:MAG: ribonuclease H-like domain-containing protein [Candidatus Magasanikbacteria bacterium]|nr:ribonuclease H-like domain-containing protein [Candidatus Magasanikbacteria bacterium]